MKKILMVVFCVFFSCCQPRKHIVNEGLKELYLLEIEANNSRYNSYNYDVYRLEQIEKKIIETQQQIEELKRNENNFSKKRYY